MSNIQYQISNKKNSFGFRISDFGFKIKNLSGGFTLVELLVSLILLTTVFSIIFAIVWISLRNTIKVNNMNNIRQNGNYTISQMTKMLQFATEFNGLSNDDISYTTVCQNPQNSSLTYYKYVKFQASDFGAVTFGCLSSPATIASNGASFINSDEYSVESCGFSCTQKYSDSSVNIGIRFIIKKLLAGNPFDIPAPLLFQTSVNMRNSSK
jgi:type II secretory pathway pseudopilin PulG